MGQALPRGSPKAHRPFLEGDPPRHDAGHRLNLGSTQATKSDGKNNGTRVAWVLGAFREFFDSVKLKEIPRIAGGGYSGKGSWTTSAVTVPNELSSPLYSRLFPVGRHPKRARKCSS
jgi:hypothetical protein